MIFFIMERRKYTISVVLLLFCTSVFALKTDAIKYEYRAVWLTTIENLDWPKTRITSPADVDRQKKELTAILDSLSRLNVNTVILQTRLRGDVIYPSSYEPFSAVLTGVVGKSPGYDPLAFAIEECHKRGMQLHAWLVTLPLGKIEYVRKLGRLSLRYKNPRLCHHHKGQWYMEPGEPATSEYLCKLVSEIVTNYDVDGIHLDYIRYPDRPDGYSDTHLFRRYGKGMTLADWRRANITRIVHDIYSRVKMLKPWVRVSCAPLGKYDDLSLYSSRGWNARNTVFQDAQLWMQDGIMDAVFPMLYFSGNDFYPFVRDWQEHSNGRHVVPGVGVYRLLSGEGNWPLIEIKRQLCTSRHAGTAGSALFRARHLLDNIKNAADEYKLIYEYPALPPPMQWATDFIPSMPQEFVGERVGDTLRLSWRVVDSRSDEPPLKYNIYASHGASVDISNPRNLMAVSVADTSYIWVGSTLNSMSWAVVPVSAYGVEGQAAFYTERGAEPALFCDEFIFPEPSTWGMQIVLRDAVGRQLYRGPYHERVGVRGLPQGIYLLEIVSREGTVLERRQFVR